ncbi:MAG: 2-amino-4-hydroxy-6-hydroxymethyldihydropteridine diphosphokinase [Planctomycetes bacterium]|nr:2-amino-4-hydroxy-6-hydroxymethyldihydropteridine diphosphokinase [Planctomycetota bacterium]
MPRSFIALGGNLGPVSETFQNALERLDNDPRVTVQRISRFYRTAPVGDDAGGEFLNAAAEIETDLEPIPLLDLLLSVETEFGRNREIHWGPRTLDLDLILYGEEIIDLPRLRVPHPACWYRRFVLDPLSEIAADVIHPEKGISIGQLRSRLLKKPFRVGIAGADPTTRTSLIETLQPEFPDVEFLHWKTAGKQSPLQPTLLAWLGCERNGEAEPSGFESLPRVPRLDVSTVEHAPATFLRHVLQSALGR